VSSEGFRVAAPGLRAEDRAGHAADRDAVARIAAVGDETGLADLYDRHSTAVYSLALRIVKRPEDAEDVTQQVFTQAWRTAAQYDHGRGAVAAWLLMMSRSRAIDCLRRRNTSHDGESPDAALAAIPDPGPSVEYIVATREQVERARTALEALPDEQREAVHLAYYGGLTQSEIAERTSAPLGTVKSRVRSALQALRVAMGASATPAGDRP
jgi:RNA polymerase sigma-70 factor (ECF subfamily)